MSIRRQTLYDDAGKPVAIMIPTDAESISPDASYDVKGKIVDLSVFHGVIKREDLDGLAMQEEMRRVESEND